MIVSNQHQTDQKRSKGYERFADSQVTFEVAVASLKPRVALILPALFSVSKWLKIVPFRVHLYPYGYADKSMIKRLGDNNIHYCTVVFY